MFLGVGNRSKTELEAVLERHYECAGICHESPYYLFTDIN